MAWTNLMERLADMHGFGKIFIVEERPNPSTDYFVLPAVGRYLDRVVRRNAAEPPAPEELQDALVVFVRYVAPAWRREIDRARKTTPVRIVLFLDDDLLDASAFSSMPWSYRLKLLRLTTWQQKWLRNQKASLWVATPYLEEKYAAWQPLLLSPVPIAPAKPVTRRFFYHGSASHRAEIHWLRPIVEKLLARDAGFAFEIVGDLEVNRLYRSLRGVTIVHPMNWSSYQQFLAIPGRHIGLAPLFDEPFNRARSYTKFFDITRCGAVGVFSRQSVFAQVVVDGENGLLVDSAADAWQEALLMLAEDEPLRRKMLDRARETMAALSNGAIERTPSDVAYGSPQVPPARGA